MRRSALTQRSYSPAPLASFVAPRYSSAERVFPVIRGPTMKKRSCFGTILMLSALGLAAKPGLAGECWFPELCTEPCPAESSCGRDSDCDYGMWCVPSCLPSLCYCGTNSEWVCTWDCAGECVEAPPWAGPPAYVIIPLGALGGFNSIGLAINDCGQVAGGADTYDRRREAFLWDGGVMTALGTLSGLRHSEAWGINNNGQVAGISVDYYGGDERGFLWQNGEMVDLGDLGGGETNVAAVNDAGQVVGRSYLAFGEEHNSHPYIWQDGVMTDLYDSVGLGGAHDISNSGSVAGSVPTDLGPHAAIWDGVSIRILGTLGGDFATALGTNENGQAVGKSEREPGGRGLFHAFFWDGGEMLDLGALGGFRGSYALAINNRGQAVGAPSFLYDADGIMHDLLSLISPESGWRSLGPRDINDEGQIVGDGMFRGRLVAFLMTPLDGDFNDDGETDLGDAARFVSCLTGSGAPISAECKVCDIDRDGVVDLRDVVSFQWAFGTRSENP